MSGTETLIKKLKQLQKENRQLKRDHAVMAEALKFYGLFSNWETNGMCVMVDVDRGQRARDSLKGVKQIANRGKVTAEQPTAVL